MFALVAALAAAGIAGHRFANLAACPEKCLLWFHHVRWDHRMRSGRTMWDELALHYKRGVDWMRVTHKEWDALAAFIDPEQARRLSLRPANFQFDSCCVVSAS